MSGDRDRAQQWLAEVLHQAETGGCDCGMAERADHDYYSGILAAAILDTPGVEVEEQWGSRMWMVDDPSSVEDSEVPLGKDRTEARVAFHERKQREEPGWRGRCAPVRRWVITTPWSPVEPVKEEKSGD